MQEVLRLCRCGYMKELTRLRSQLAVAKEQLDHSHDAAFGIVGSAGAGGRSPPRGAGAAAGGASPGVRRGVA